MASGKKAAPRIGVALGGGGARGLAHITVLEAFDELGIRPARIAGTSMGALVGAVYASGVPAAELRAHVLEMHARRGNTLRRLVAETGPNFIALLGRKLSALAVLEGESVLEVFWPDGVARRFEDLEIPFTASATDYYGRREHVLRDGSLREAVAASIALPGLIAPRLVEGRVLFDGGMVNPLPADHLSDVDLTVGVDVTGGPVESGQEIPPFGDVFFRSLQIMQYALIEARLATHPVDVLIRPAVDPYRVLDFLRIEEILAAAEPARDQLKRALEQLPIR